MLVVADLLVDSPGPVRELNVGFADLSPWPMGLGSLVHSVVGVPRELHEDRPTPVDDDLERGARRGSGRRAIWEEDDGDDGSFGDGGDEDGGIASRRLRLYLRYLWWARVLLCGSACLFTAGVIVAIIAAWCIWGEVGLRGGIVVGMFPLAAVIVL